jgi:hypothetical protein
MVNTETIAEQIKKGFVLAGAWLLGMLWLGVVFTGLSEAFAPATSFAEGHHPHRILGYALLTVAGVTMVLATEHWKKVFPGIMLAAVYNSLLELLHGHEINFDSVPVSPPTAIVHLLVMGGVAILTLTFKGRGLSIFDKASLVAFVGMFFWQAVDHRFAELKLIGSALCVLLAWIIDRRLPSSGHSPAKVLKKQSLNHSPKRGLTRHNS